MRSEYFQNGDQRLFVTFTGDGPALIFAHGLFGTHADATWLADVADGHAVIAPDLRGRGASRPSRSVENHTFDAHVADLLVILAHFSIDQAVVCGSSFGAAVAVAFALQHLERVAGLVLIASAFGAARDEMGEGNLAAYGELADRIESEGLERVIRLEVERTGSTRPISRWAQHDEASLVAWLRAVPLYRPFQRIDELARVSVPALVVAGEDAVHTPALSEAYARALPQAITANANFRDNALRSFLRSLAKE